MIRTILSAALAGAVLSAGPAVASEASGSDCEVKVNAPEVDSIALKLPLIDLFDIRSVEDEQLGIDLLNIPLLRGEISEVDAEGDITTDLFADVPVFRLFKGDFSDEQGTFNLLELPLFSTLRGGYDQATEAYDFAFLDSPIITAYKNNEVKDRTSWALLDTFIGTTAGKSVRSDENWRTQLIDFGLIKGLSSRKDGEERKIHLLDFSVFETYDYEKDGADGVVHFARGPFFHLYKKDFDEDYQQTDVLNLPLKTLLYRNESDDEGASHTRFLRLPILGSTFERVDDAHHTKTKLFWVFTHSSEKD